MLFDDSHILFDSSVGLSEGLKDGSEEAIEEGAITYTQVQIEHGFSHSLKGEPLDQRIHHNGDGRLFCLRSEQQIDECPRLSRSTLVS